MKISAPRSSARKIKVAVDFHLLSPGGKNGGIKPAVFGFISEISGLYGAHFEFLFLVNRTVADEVSSSFGREKVFVVQSAPRAMASRPGRRMPLRVRWLLRDVDVLYAPLWFSPFQSANLPTVVLFADMLHRDFPEMLSGEPERQWRDEVISSSARTAFRIQCISRSMADRVQRYYDTPASKLFITHLPLGHRVISQVNEAGFHVVRPYFIYPANLWPHKNHQRLLLAFREYKKEGGDWDLVLTGFELEDSRSVALQAVINESRDLLGSVHVCAYLSKSMYSMALRNAGAMVFPSLYEGFGMPVLEAMTNGIPVATSSAGALPEVVADAALIFDPLDVTALTRILWSLSARPELREELSRRGLVRAATFSIRVETEKLARAFVEAAGSPPDLLGAANV
jgi:glycosyltransferase involved in cell wall biosynthesis